MAGLGGGREEDVRGDIARETGTGTVRERRQETKAAHTIHDEGRGARSEMTSTLRTVARALTPRGRTMNPP